MIPSPTVNAQQIQELDRIAIEEFGIPSLVLMENAGRAVVQEIWRTAANRLPQGIIIFCGTGNNGGDGLVIARYLLEKGLPVTVFIIGKKEQLKEDSMAQYRLLQRLGYKVEFVSNLTDHLISKVIGAAVIVDALFGVGLNRATGGIFNEVIRLINHSKKFVVAVDIPSGLNATTGESFGECVKADVTVTFSLLKSGLSIGDGPQHAGRIVVADIGIPLSLCRKIMEQK